jgi:ParB-like chromosome segregation protein Spo0J
MGTTVEIPIAQVRLQRLHEGLALNPAKLENAIARAQRAGQISPPVVVRRLRDGYLLLDGLYRLRAAQTLGHERIPAVIEA